MPPLGPGASAAYIQFPTFTGLVPKEGPKAIPYIAQFGTVQSYTIDLQQQVSMGQISLIQCVFIDNSANASPVTFTVAVTGQQIVCPGNSQGYYPVLSPNPPRFTVYSVGAANVGIFLLNMPINPGEWSAVSSGNKYDTSGNLYTADANMATAIIAGYVNSMSWGHGNNDIPRPLWNGNTMLYGTLTPTASTATIATGAPSFFLTTISIDINADVYYTGGAYFSFLLLDGTTPIFRKRVYIPASAGTPTQASGGIYEIYMPMTYNSSGANQALTCQSRIGGTVTAITGGEIDFQLFGGFTNLIG